MPLLDQEIEALFAEAQTFHAQGLVVPAQLRYHQVLELAPDHAPALYHLGRIAQAAGKHDLALEYVGRALEIAPESVAFYVTLGLSHKALREMDQAIDAFQQALRLDDTCLEALVNLGNVLHASNRLLEAIASFHRALELAPDFAPTHLNLGNALKDSGQLEEAILHYRRAIALEPSLAEAYNNLGYAYQLLGQLEEAVAAYRKALSLRPTFEACHANLLFCLLYLPSSRPDRLFAEQRRWDEVHARPLTPSRVRFAHSREPERCLRLGYVSPNFRQHSDAHFLEPLLRGHDRRSVSVTCFSDAGAGDEVTERLRPLADHWHDTSALSHEAFVELVRSSEIDILLDVAGLTRHHRLLAFARRAAPLQVSYHGFGSSGMTAMDFRLTDAVADPPGSERFHSERLLRLRRCFAAYRMPETSPPVAPLGLSARGYVQFGSFNNPSKINFSVIEVWSRIMQEVKGSRLVLKYATFVSPTARQRMLDAFSRFGISRERLTLLGHTPDRAAHLKQYEEIDVALDPFPYSGSVTTFEALWMGVPVITLAGSSFIGRMSASLLSHIGCQEFITDTPKRYVSRVKALASDRGRLSSLRQTLRERIISSRLCDGQDMASAVETALREAFSEWCGKAIG